MSDYLPVEVVTEILKRLPVKSLLRFSCVCKEWYSLISSPSFISIHLSHTKSSPTTHTLVSYYNEMYAVYDNAFTGESTRINYPWKYMQIVSYYNGVMCLSDGVIGYEETIFLWNPSIRRAINVPAPKLRDSRFVPCLFALGFGYDPVSDDYKIVRVAYLDDGIYKLPQIVEVFSVSTGEWRVIERNITSCVTELLLSQAVKDNVVHWTGYKKMCGNKLVGHKTERNPLGLIVSFNLSTEMFGEMNFPKPLENSPFSNKIAMLRGSFSAFCLTGMSCAIWVMKEYGNVDSWVNQYNVDWNWGEILGVLRDDEILVASEHGRLFSYNLEKETSTVMGRYNPVSIYFADKYVESLVLVGKGREVPRRWESDNEQEYELV